MEMIFMILLAICEYRTIVVREIFVEIRHM
jgi:hypothetical protein